MPITPLHPIQTMNEPSGSRSSVPKEQHSPSFLQKLTSIVHDSDINLLSADKSDDQYVRWGRDFRDLKTNPNERCIYWFDDTYKGARRLNILGHGHIDTGGKGKMGLLLEGKRDRVDGADLKYMYDYHYRAETLVLYQYIRVISCNSADGSAPLGQQVANAFKRETKAFSGYVDSLSPESIAENKLNHAFKSEDNPLIDMNRLLTNTNRSFVRKTPPKEPEKQRLWSGYNPVKFKPQ